MATWLCLATGHPVGTDTMMVGMQCHCQVCEAAAEIERLRADYEAMKKLALSLDDKDEARLDEYRLEVIEECAKEAWRAWMEDANVYNAGDVICRAIRALSPQQRGKDDPPDEFRLAAKLWTGEEK